MNYSFVEPNNEDNELVTPNRRTFDQNFMEFASARIDDLEPPLINSILSNTNEESGNIASTSTESSNLGTDISTHLYGSSNNRQSSLISELLESRQDENNEASRIQRKAHYNSMHNDVKKLIFNNKHESLFSTCNDEEDTVDLEIDLISLEQKLDEFKITCKKYYTDLCLAESTLSKHLEIVDSVNTSCLEFINKLATNLNDEISEEDTKLKEIVTQKIKQLHDQHQIEKLKKERNTALKKFSLLKETLCHVKDLSMLQVCPLCWDKQVTHFLIPCGHVLCEDCKEKQFPHIPCSYCRAKPTKFGKLFFTG